jgi:mRNA interferase MazF
MSLKAISRGDIWIVNFDPSVGTETQKARPAVVVQIGGLSRLDRTIVVPITSWQSHFDPYQWMLHLQPTAQNGLRKESCVDTLQVKSVDNSRFQSCIGTLGSEDMGEIAAAIAFCVGYQPSSEDF